MTRMYTIRKRTAEAKPEAPPEKSLLARTYRLMDQLETTVPPEEKDREKAQAYFYECGCNAGAFFLIGGVVATIGYSWYFDPSFLLSCRSLLLVTAAALTGKLAGILMARGKLWRMYRSLEKTCTEKNVSKS